MNKSYSIEHEKYLKNMKIKNRFVVFFQIFIIILFLIIWELFAKYEIINTFLISSPSKIFNTIIELIKNKILFNHITITLYEVIICFLISTIVGFVISILLWRYNLLYKIIEPYLTILNSLPKVALGPLIIIFVGANINSIIFMGILISTFISIINIYNAFISTDKNYITLLKSFGATKKQIFYKVILPSNYLSIISSLKINISMNLIGVIMGELLVSKRGLGYLINYGSQVFNINLVITGIFILGVISYILYFLVERLEIYIKKRNIGS